MRLSFASFVFASSCSALGQAMFPDRSSSMPSARLPTGVCNGGAKDRWAVAVRAGSARAERVGSLAGRRGPAILPEAEINGRGCGRWRKGAIFRTGLYRGEAGSRRSSTSTIVRSMDPMPGRRPLRILGTHGVMPSDRLGRQGQVVGRVPGHRCAEPHATMMPAFAQGQGIPHSSSRRARLSPVGDSVRPECLCLTTVEVGRVRVRSGSGAC